MPYLLSPASRYSLPARMMLGVKVLVVGSGGREHAIAWKVTQSPKVSKLYATPGNPGMAKLAECIAWDGDVGWLADWAAAEGIGLTLVGPEAPLVEGIADAFEAKGLKIFGPAQRAAMIEGSKVFAKDLMERFGIPTAQHRSFSDTFAALAYLEQVGAPIVVKDSGLAAGKGVTVATDLHQAKQAVINILESPEPSEIVIEEFLRGPEVTVLAITDGTTIKPLLPSQDHKRLADGDTGAMTGGMGKGPSDSSTRSSSASRVDSRVSRCQTTESIEQTSAAPDATIATDASPLPE